MKNIKKRFMPDKLNSSGVMLAAAVNLLLPSFLCLIGKEIADFQIINNYIEETSIGYYQKIVFLCLGLSIVILGVIDYIFLIKPVFHLESTVEEYKTLTRMEDSAVYEKYLADSSIERMFLEMLEEQKFIQQQNQIAENQRQETELLALQTQINPHFLYNTLALICGMSTEGRSDDIINISQALAQILRYSIKGNEFVTFREELEIVKSYLMIQSTRFEGRFTIEYSISDEIMDACIPKMILQPLVENSIVHGLEKLLEPGHLQIGGMHDSSNDTLIIWVYDTGEGISVQRLSQIRESLNRPKTMPSSMEESLFVDSPGEESESLGLLNVNSRIRLYYGEPYHLIIESKEHIETNIQIRIPFQLQRKE